MHKYILYLMLKESGKFVTFWEAFEKLYWAVKKQAEEGKPRNVLFPTNYIVYEYSDTAKGIYFKSDMNFEKARDFAYDIGYLSKDGKLTKPEKEIPEETVIREFLKF